MKLFFGGLLSGLIGAILIQQIGAALQEIYKKRKGNEKINQVKKTDNKEMKEIKEEQFSRNIAFFGEDGQEKIRKSFVVIIGLGGVGSHAAHMLARSGVEKLRLIDFDLVTVSSLNRHAVATYSDVGIPKVTCLKNHIRNFAPFCEVDALKEMCDSDSVGNQLNGHPDYVLDCIDDINTKASLVAYCKSNNIRVLTAMGAGAKADPTRLRIGDITDCLVDKLASKLRWKLEKMGAIPKNMKNDSDPDLGIKVIYSAEKPLCGLVQLDEDQVNNPSEYGAMDNFRLRTIPVLGSMPAIMGQAMASYCLMELGEKKIKVMATENLTEALKNKMLLHLKKREREVYKVMDGNDVMLDGEDINVIVSEIWRCRSAISGVRQGRARMTLTRWNRNKPASIGNLVLLTDSEADYHDGNMNQDYLDDEIRTRIEQILKESGKWYTL